MGVSLIITPLGDKQTNDKENWLHHDDAICPAKTREQKTGL